MNSKHLAMSEERCSHGVVLGRACGRCDAQAEVMGIVNREDPQEVAQERNELREIRQILLETRVQVDVLAVKHLQYEVSRLIGRHASAANTGRGFLTETENKVLGEIWSLLKDLA